MVDVLVFPNEFPAGGINVELLGEELSTINVGLSTSEFRITFHLPVIEDETAARTILANHISTQLSVPEILVANQADVTTHFDASVLKNKTPQQIFDSVQTSIDGWAQLADAQADLRDWLPLAFAIIAWKVQEG